MSPRIGSELRRQHKRELAVLGDARADVDAILAKYPNKRSALPQLLFLVQSIDGYVTEEGMRDVGQILDIEPAEVLAVASFYTMFKKTPQGDYLISVCRNISCTHLGARKVLRALEGRLGIAAGETTPDGRFSLEAAECLATCDGAPSLQVNYEDFYKVTADTALYLVDRIERGDPVESVAGATVKTSKEVARETALTGTKHSTDRMTPDSARIVGGESPAANFAPNTRPPISDNLADPDGAEDGVPGEDDAQPHDGPERSLDG